eukprot:4490153-Prymnesium_polylepis.3
MRRVCPSQPSCRQERYVSMLLRPSRFSRSLVEMRCNQVCLRETRHMPRTHRAWKTRSRCSITSVTLQLSAP